MRVDDFITARAWREPAEPQDDGSTPAPASTSAPSPAAAPAVPFWNAEAAPAAPNALNELAPAPLQPAPVQPAAAAPAPPPPAAPSAYVGEQAVDRQWLADREAALVSIRRDYEGARAAAQAQPGGAGWRAATMVSDESGQLRSASGNTAVFVADPNAAPELIGYDESGAALTRAGGQWLEFDEAAFAASYRAQNGAPLQALAAQYGSDSATLFAQHPELWTIATSDHALNAGPPPPGRAMGDAAQLGTLDLYLADPQIRALIDAYGGSAAPASGGIAPEQQRIYGARRYEELTKLGQAMLSVRDQYTNALAQAQAAGSGPGWVDRPRTITVADESGATRTEPAYVTDESGARLLDANGQPQVVNERVFDVDAFTAWYEQQPGLANRAFGSFYGASHTQYGTDEAGQRVIAETTFDNPSWSVAGGRMAHRELVSIDPNRPPELNDNNAVGFDLEAGWATHQSNIREDRDWFETVVQVAIVAAVTYVSAGTLGPAVAGAMGFGTGTLAAGVVSAAVAGAAGSAVSGAMNGNLSLKGVLQGALAGGLTAGLMGGIGGALNVTSPLGTVALRTTVQGGIQALLGGSFKDGAIAGFASGLAQLASDGINARIDDALAKQTMTAGEALAARTFSKVVGSAIRAAGNPDDPQYAFASSFLGDLVREAGTAGAAVQPAFDDDGNLMPGIVNANATPAQQQAQLAAHLQSQGFSAEEALALAAQHFGTAPVATAPAPAAPPAPVPAPVATEPGTPEPLWTSVQGEAVMPVGSSPPTGELHPYTGEDAAFPYPERLPPGATTTALVDDAGNRYWRVTTPEGLDRTVSTSNTLPTVTVVAPRVTEAVSEAGVRFVAAGQSTVAANAAGTAVLLSGAGETLTAGELATGAGRLALGLTRLLAVPAAVLTALFTPTNATEQFVDLGDGLRFRTRPGELYGQLQQQDGNGDWQTLRGEVRLDQVQGRSMLSDDERDRLNAPIITVPPPPQPSGPPPLVPPEVRDGPLPGFETVEPLPPIIEGAPIEEPHWRDTIIERRDAQVLAGSLEAQGEPRPAPGYQPHHMIPSNDPDSAALLQRLIAAGIDPNSALNGVWLPQNDKVPNNGETPHNETFRDSYFEYLNRTFSGATTRADFEQLLAQLKDDLQNHRIDLPKKP